MNATPNRARGLRPTRALLITLFLLIGLIETLGALALFQRADDHEYFLKVANTGTAAVLDSGVEAYNLKAEIAATVFYGLMSPVRGLGGSELGHLLWLRFFTLVGFLCAFEGIRRLLPPDSADIDGKQARVRFLMLCLLYPGQLAWTASLLRDGPACAFLFIALLAWSSRKRILALLFFGLSLALRPEFAAVVLLLAVASLLFRHLRPRQHRHRITILVGALALVSLAVFGPRQVASEFAQYAFASEGAAYPVVAHPLDIAGYAMVLVQGLIDPLSLAAPAAVSPFILAETLFFVWVVASGLRRLRYSQVHAAGLIAGLIVSLWLFAYLEIYVSGYSRHRLALVVLMLALIALIRPAALRQRHSVVAVTASTPPMPTAHP